jgi:hypothetical protein
LLVTTEHHAEVQMITTDNGAANETMLAINRASGFGTVRTWQTWMLTAP